MNKKVYSATIQLQNNLNVKATYSDVNRKIQLELTDSFSDVIKKYRDMSNRSVTSPGRIALKKNYDESVKYLEKLANRLIVSLEEATVYINKLSLKDANFTEVEGE